MPVSTAGGPAPRSGVASCYVAGSVQRWFHYGGLGLRRHGDLWALDPHTLRWERLHDGNTQDAPPPRCKAALVHVVTGSGADCLLMWGGWCGGKQDKLNDAWLFNLPSRTWAPVAQSGQVPPPRSSLGLVTLPSSTGQPASASSAVILFGGIGANKYGDMYLGSLGTAQSKAGRSIIITWTPIRGGNAGLPPRSSFGKLLLRSAGTSPQLVLFGGLTCGQLNDVLSVPVDALLRAEGGFRVTPLSATSQVAPWKRGRHSSDLVAANGNDYLCVFGGTNLRSRDNALHVFDFSTSEWRPAVGRASAAGPPPPLEGHSSAVIDRAPLSGSGGPPQPHLFIWGGYRGEQGWCDHMYILPLLPALLAAPSPSTATTQPAGNMQQAAVGGTAADDADDDADVTTVSAMTREPTDIEDDEFADGAATVDGPL